MTVPTRIQPNRRTFLKGTAVATAAVATGFPLIAKGAAEHTLKIATLAPDGSSWHKAFKQVARDVKEQTDGRIAIKIYAGGVMGDEPAMVRKTYLDNFRAHRRELEETSRALGAAFYSFVTAKPLIDSITYFLHHQRVGVR